MTLRDVISTNCVVVYGMGLVDADIRRAATLPSRYYTGPDLFEELRRCFGEHWCFAGHASEAEVDSILPLAHVEAQTGEPMLLTKQGGGLSIISGVCTHRGMILVDEPCQGKVIQCPYHGRTFGLDGSFRAMPGFEDVEDFPTPKDDLATFASESWNGFHFTTLGATDFDGWFKPFAERMAWWPKDWQIVHDPSRHRDHTIDANWIAYVDNYLEGFHIPHVHGDLHSILDHGNYRTELFDGGVLQVGIAKEGELCFDLPFDAVDYGVRIAAYYWWFFPGLMLNVYPWGMSVNIVIPETVRRTRVIYQGYVTNQSMSKMGAGSNLDKVEKEDQSVVEGVQRGMFSATYDCGRYSPEHEIGVHHFHRTLLRSLTPSNN